jgi:hypothetical protein
MLLDDFWSLVWIVVWPIRTILWTVFDLLAYAVF